jgi:hypothetical protein
MLPLCWTLLLVVVNGNSIATSTSYYATRDMCKAAATAITEQSAPLGARTAWTCALANSPTVQPN